MTRSEVKMILRGHTFSKILEMETGITVITPNELSDKCKYKVAYMLHGLCGRSGDLARNIKGDQGKPVIYASCGTGDFLRESNVRFKEGMESLDFDFTFEEWEGSHDWYFFNESVRRALKHISLK